MEGTVASRRGLRDAYASEILDALVASLEDVPSGEWEGVPVVTEPKLRAAIESVFSAPVPLTPDRHAELATPATLLIHAICPRCGIPADVSAFVASVLTVDDDGAEIAIKTKAKARTHVCGQLRLVEGTSSDVDEPTFGLDDVVGETTESLVLDSAPEESPTDLAEEVDDRCGAEVASGDPEVRYVCGRAIDHEGEHYDPTVVAAWHFETVPVPREPELENGETPIGLEETDENVEPDDEIGGES